MGKYLQISAFALVFVLVKDPQQDSTELFYQHMWWFLTFQLQ